MNKEKFFRLSNRLAQVLVIIFALYFVAAYYGLVPNIGIAYFLLFLAIYSLSTYFYCKKTVGGFGVIATGRNAFWVSIIRSIVLLIMGVIILVHYWR